MLPAREILGSPRVAANVLPSPEILDSEILTEMPAKHPLGIPGSQISDNRVTGNVLPSREILGSEMSHGVDDWSRKRSQVT